MKVRIMVLDGKHAGQQMQLPATQFVIGRAPSCHLRPASAEVSRFHCAIATYCGCVHVRDLKSRNGTFVNERRITGVRLHAGDILRVGPLRLEMLIESDDSDHSSARPTESGLGWLVRNPDELETAALDPSVCTMIGPPHAFAVPEEMVPVRVWRVDSGHEDAGAVAGGFLREYLHRRNAHSA